ncbi:hypothetical protein TNCT_688681 [Trichonephila clavata]|uniref:Uncharacterized protein n=1 Tax=Trichonephila clavata TaxID=2740835 RepID=A0A8X6JNV2_TRICU|nr:hypothetical protein TNCT_688681 [Trichonephila clavata]
MPLKTILHVSDVYNDSHSDSDNESINEESPLPSHLASKSPADACRKTDGTVRATVLPKDICAGLYVIVKLLYKPGEKITQYHYVGVYQSDIDEGGEIRVQFLTTIEGKPFTEIVNDISGVQCEDIITKLKAPEQNTDGNIVFMEFSANIDVFEKK